MPPERSQSPQDAFKSAQAHYDAQLPDSDCGHVWRVTTKNPRHYRCVFCARFIAPYLNDSLKWTRERIADWLAENGL